ncbi:hypothetical protein [Aeromicrobium alkaliterrae]|uniref:Uncharacterized protein n=1 Tax=Aeromicrobium alkaliterrae TaxID=302168 RepID=A0ABP4W1G6_9ACTN
MGHASADDAEYERLRRQNSAAGYTGSGFGLNDNEELGGMRLPQGADGPSPRWSRLVATALLVVVGTVVVVLLF